MSIETTWSCSFEVTRLTFVKFFTMVVSFVFIERDLSSGLPVTLVTRESPCSMHCLDVLAEVALIFLYLITDRTSCTNTSFVNNLLMFDCDDFCRTFKITVTVATIKHCEFFYKKIYDENLIIIRQLYQKENLRIWTTNIEFKSTVFSGISGFSLDRLSTCKGLSAVYVLTAPHGKFFSSE